MPTVETSIWLALKARKQALILSPVLSVAWPNESFKGRDVTARRDRR